MVESDDGTHLVELAAEAVIEEPDDDDDDIANTPIDDDTDELNPLKGSRERTGSAAKAVVTGTLFSNPVDPVITEENTNDFQAIDDASPTEQDIKAKTLQSEKKEKIKRYAKYVFLLLWIVYSLAAFIIDFNRAKILFIIEMIVICFLIIKEIYNKWCVGVPTKIINCVPHTGVCVYIFYAFLILAVIAVIILCTYQEPARLMSLVGLFVFILCCYVFSWHRSDIKWRPVIWGFGLQFTFALLILRTNIGFSVFNYLGSAFKTLLDFTLSGSGFVFSYLATGNAPFDNASVFACSVIPTVIFFSSLVSILYYLGFLQILIYYLSILMQYTLGTSSSESLNAAGNIFVGMTEAPLLIKPFLADMTRSELHAVMTGGFATIAGGVMAIYIYFGVSASHLLSASVMSAPAALAISKIVYPENEVSPTANTEDKSAQSVLKQIGTGNESNVIEAAANGASIAVGLAANIIGMLIAFLGLVSLLDYLFAWFGSLINWDITFTSLCGYIFYPMAVIMGIHPDDALIAGELIGQKVVVNEFVAYTGLLSYTNTISSRSQTILIYALCGFSNFGAMGITLGGLTPLAPKRTKDLTQLVLSAMISGNIACFMTACIAALLYDPDRFD